MEWLSGQDVPLVQIDWRGHASSIGGASYAANPNIIKHQLEMQKSSEGFEFVKSLIIDKLNHACETILSFSDDTPEIESRVAKIRDLTARIKGSECKSVKDLRNLESIAAVSYFQCWGQFEIRWRGIGRKPIPPEWKRIGTRIGKNGNSNQFATHPFNAILNYAYGVLEHQVKGLTVATGFDPSIGFMHSPRQSSSSLIYDLMEPVRPVMDKHILKVMLGRTFSPDDFVLNKEGVVRLHPQFARFLVKSIQDIPEINKITENNLKKLIKK